MHRETIQQIVEEIGPLLVGRYPGTIFQLGPLSFAIDFGLREGRYLFMSVEPGAPRFYLIKRRLKELQKQSISLSQFGAIMRSKLNAAEVLSITKDPSDRVIRLLFRGRDDLGQTENRVLVAQLTGRSANVLLLNEQGQVTHALRPPIGPGQTAGEQYQSPKPQANAGRTDEPILSNNFDSLSAALDSYYQRETAERSFQLRANDLRARLRKEIRQNAKLKQNLQNDLADHGRAEDHKRLGDLLLANLSTAKRDGSTVSIQDLYSEGAPWIQVELDEDISLQEAASRCFARYTKAKRAAEEIAARLVHTSQKHDELLTREAALERIIEQHDEAALAGFEKPAVKSKIGQAKTRAKKIPGVQSFRSSDGYEILVGRGARDNDYLTFRVARPNDLWLHAADYPGSHVVVRRENRSEIPHRTIIEAAQLAARFSDASKDSKVVVHYTQRKFLAKPKGAAPGLVRMSSFKTILVQPKVAVERI